MHISKTRAAAGAVAILATGAGAWTGGAVASASTLTCVKQASIIQSPPSVGSSTTVNATINGATNVGHYTVGQPTAGSLTASGAVANTGWTASIPLASGTRVRVVFHSSTSSALDRFTTSLSSTGLKLITHVVTCT